MPSLLPHRAAITAILLALFSLIVRFDFIDITIAYLLRASIIDASSIRHALLAATLRAFSKCQSATRANGRMPHCHYVVIGFDWFIIVITYRFWPYMVIYF